MMKAGVYWSKIVLWQDYLCPNVDIYYIALDLFCLGLASLTLLHRKNRSQIIVSIVGPYTGNLSRLKW